MTRTTLERRECVVSTRLTLRASHCSAPSHRTHSAMWGPDTRSRVARVSPGTWCDAATRRQHARHAARPCDRPEGQERVGGDAAGVPQPIRRSLRQSARLISSARGLLLQKAEGVPGARHINSHQQCPQPSGLGPRKWQRRRTHRVASGAALTPRPRPWT